VAAIPAWPIATSVADRFCLPDKAIDRFDEAAAQLRMEGSLPNPRWWMGAEAELAPEFELPLLGVAEAAPI